MTTDLITERLAVIDEQIERAWIAAEMFLKNRDPHGVMDMGAELQALHRAKAEIITMLR
jgi:hypothetical protein